MPENTEKKNSISAKDHRRICFGILLIAFSLIAFSGMTVVGEFLSYGLAYLFGLFFPVFCLLLILYGIALIFFRKPVNPGKHSAFLLLGFFFVILSSLALGSLSLAKGNDNISFSSFTGYYMTRMKSFASKAFTVDSFEAVTSLGGGYVGLFLLMLLRSVWGDIGNTIFFVALLLLGLFLLLFLPLSYLILGLKKRKAEKVDYNSPFHPEKGKEKEVLVREPEAKKEPAVTIDPMLKKPLSEAIQKRENEEKKHATSVLETAVFESFKTENFPVSSTKETKTEETTAPVSKSDTTPVTSQEKNVEAEREPEECFRREASILDTTSFQGFTLPDDPVRKEAKKPELSPAVEEKQVVKQTLIISGQVPDSKPVIEPIVPEVPMKNEVRHQTYVPPVASEPVASEEKKPEPTATVVSYSSVNPLEAVAKNVQPKATREQTVIIEQEPEPEMTPKTVPEPIMEEPKKELSEEEKLHEREKQYFAKKQQKAIEAIQEKQRQRNERKAALLRFVSDTPKFYSYPLPTDALLQEHDDSAKMMINKEAADQKVHVINDVFRDYDVKAKAVSYTVGASVTRFNIETEPGERSDKIASLVDELQRSLNGDKSVRVETVVEGRNTSGIEVGNAAPMAVSFKDVFESVETNTSDNLLLPIGKDISGNIITCPLNKMPHLLIAGTTGSGKSVLVHSMIMTLIMRNYPSQMKLILIDPKQVEFIRYQECSHLFCPVISKPEKAVLALKKLVDEMERRFTVFSKYRVANIEGYYKARKGQETIMEEMPYLVCVIDEFADLMMTGGKDVVNNVQRIGQKARAAGIHMIIATQRPSKDTVPMMIKANVPCRIGLSCSAQVDSRVILDENGAETLLGRGDLLFKDSARKSLVRAQSPYLSDEEIDKILAYVKEKAGDPVYDRAFLELEEEDDEEENVEEIDPQKRLYEDIKDFVIHTGITSKESIMRNFQLTSSKADSYLASMVSEQVLMLGYGGEYNLGPAAITIRQKENL